MEFGEEMGTVPGACLVKAEAQHLHRAPQHLSQPPRVRMWGIAFGQLLVMPGDKDSKKFGHTHLTVR